MQRNSSEAGIALVHVLFIVITVMGLSAALLTSVTAGSNEVDVYRKKLQSLALAESAVEAAQYDLMIAVAHDKPVPTSGTLVTGPHTTDYLMEPVTPEVLITEAESGLSMRVQNYKVQADAEYSLIKTRVSSLVQVQRIPIFQYLLYYAGDLELIARTVTELDGRLFATGDIFAGAIDQIDLKTTYLRASGNIYRRWKHTGAPTVGTVTIKNKQTTGQVGMSSKGQLEGISVPSFSGFDSDFAGYDANADGDFSDPGELGPFVAASEEMYGGSLKTGEHGVREVSQPTIGSIKMFEFVGELGGDYKWNGTEQLFEFLGAGLGTHMRGFYHDTADVVLRDGVLYDELGLPLTAGQDAVSFETFYDAREGTDIMVTTLDMAALSAAGVWPENGLLYAVRTDATVSQPNGICLTNGSLLEADITVVSQNPVFIHGDFNDDSSKSVAVIGDAINILSGAFDFSKAVGKPMNAATPTTVVCGLIGGNVPSMYGAYSGGFENLMRFHENWTGVNLNYVGASACIWASELAAGAFATGSPVFEPPNHLWTYDTRFDDVNTLPPFTPYAVDVKVLSWAVGGAALEDPGEIEGGGLPPLGEPLGEPPLLGK